MTAVDIAALPQAPSPLLLARHAPGSPAVAHRPRLATAQWLLTLDEKRFAHQVSQDVRGLLKPEVAAGLRDPGVAARWVCALRAVLERMEWDLADRDRREAPGYVEWRIRVRDFRRHAMRRLDEARRLLADAGAGESR